MEQKLKRLNLQISRVTADDVGVDKEEEAFDVVLMVHPEAVPSLPAECKRIEEGFTAKHAGKGACLYHPYMGISYRDPSFDMYMNSQECLIGPGTEFLDGYKVLLRFRPHLPPPLSSLFLVFVRMIITHHDD